jgi:hypothetical protein
MFIKNKKALKTTAIKTFTYQVPGTGIEPAHPCERQILSLLRLPIPPSGLNFGRQYYVLHLISPKYIQVISL